MTDIPPENCPNCLCTQPVTALKCGMCGIALGSAFHSSSKTLRFLPELFCSFGIALFVGGILCLIFAVTRDSRVISVGDTRVWVVDITIGAIIAGAIGSGLSSFG